MLTRLSPPQYSKVLALFEPLYYNLVIRSVIEGNTPAWMYADNVTNPRTALIWDRQDAILVAGEAREGARVAVRDLIRESIVPDARQRWIPEFALSPAPDWEAVIPALLAEFSPTLAACYSYRLAQPRLDPPGFSGLLDLPAGFELRRVDDGLLDSQLVHLEDLRGWIDSFWATPRDFLRTGYGYCALAGDSLASWCLTVFAAGSARELGLASVPDFRQRGLATRVAAACIEHGLAHDQQIHWHCFAENQPSARIAEKLGFRLEREYSVYKLEIAHQ